MEDGELKGERVHEEEEVEEEEADLTARQNKCYCTARVLAVGVKK